MGGIDEGLSLDAERERADIVLGCPPLNIVTMKQREQLCRAFVQKRKSRFRGA